MPPEVLGLLAGTFTFSKVTEYIITYHFRAPGSAAMIPTSNLLIQIIRPKSS
jgi:hypothetical protein